MTTPSSLLRFLGVRWVMCVDVLGDCRAQARAKCLCVQHLHPYPLSIALHPAFINGHTCHSSPEDA